MIAVHPINADGSERSERYIDKLQKDDFLPVEAFFAQQAERFGIKQQRPVIVRLADPLNALPSALPAKRDWFNSVLWSLKFRCWSWQMKQASKYSGADTHLYVLYHCLLYTSPSPRDS